MSWQTAEFRGILDKAKKGDQKALKFCRSVMAGCAIECPESTLILVCEVILAEGIKDQRQQAERN